MSKSEFDTPPFEPGLYVKGDSVKRAESPREAVAAVYDGYVRQSGLEPSAETPDEDGGQPGLHVVDPDQS